MESFDPVTQRCLGLTCKALESVFLRVYPKNPETGRFNIRKYQFGLNLQISVDGQDYLNWGFDDYFLGGCTKTVWASDLGYMLRDEPTLWGDLIRCEGYRGCYKYKPQEAFEQTDFEIKFLARPDIQQKIAVIDPEVMESYEGCCKKCRVKILLIELDGRVERVNESELWLHNRTSLGLEYKTPRTESQPDRDMGRTRYSSHREYRAAVHDYEDWDDIYQQLGV